MPFIVLSSSRGTTFEATLQAIQNGTLQNPCLGLITDRPDRGCIEKASAHNVPYIVVEKQKDEDRKSYDQRIDEAITALNPSYVVPTSAGRPTLSQKGEGDLLPITYHLQPILACMGWMHILSPWFTQKWTKNILNVHPSLLPKFGGKGMYGHHVHEAVLAAREKESGITIHFMDEGVDTGEIIVQKKCSIDEDETVESLQKKVQELEKEWYPKVLAMIGNQSNQ